MKERHGKNLWKWAAAIVLGFVLGYFTHSLKGAREEVRQGVEEKAEEKEYSAEEVNVNRVTASMSREPEEKTPKDEKIIPKETSVEFKVPSGVVVAKNPWGREISRIPAAVVGGSWVALPVRACLGGDRLVIHLGEHRKAAIEKGSWRDGEEIGLWKIEGIEKIGAPELRPWREGIPLEWLPLESKGVPRSLEVRQKSPWGRFVTFSLPEDIREPGVLIQGKAVTGWTFGPLLPKGFLWAGPDGNKLEDRITFENFYIITFAAGREEQFSRALSMPEKVSPLDRLTAYTEGFRLIPKLTPEETPFPLRRKSVLKNMQALIDRLIEDGHALQVAEILDDQVLMEASDPGLLVSAVSAMSKAHGYQRAIELAENLKEYVGWNQDGNMELIDRSHSRLYQRWIGDLLKGGEASEAFRAFQRGKKHFPKDPVIHLLGAEIALAGGDWVEAEQLLQMMVYPDSLADRVRLIIADISRLRSEAGKVVIPFAPGSKQIPVTALVNETLRQGFVIDTGSSVVTIPSSSVEALGIRAGSQDPQRQVSTIGGKKTAPEVRLSSINLGGWVVYDVPALVVDIPDNPGLGLLGLNFLNHFDMEINNEKGVLMLRPKQ